MGMAQSETERNIDGRRELGNRAAETKKWANTDGIYMHESIARGLVFLSFEFYFIIYSPKTVPAPH